MIKWLASVKSFEEAQSLDDSLPHILDMKNPAQGALGALEAQDVAAIVRWINHRCLTSATVGDLPMQADLLSNAMNQMAQTGVDFVKIGLFDEADLIRCIEELKPTLDALNTPVIAVLFADQWPVQPLIPLLATVGFAGIMLDTAHKNGRGLLDHLSINRLQKFVSEVKSAGLLCGLAGALKIEDIQLLKGLEADYLGFRSALCPQHSRIHSLDPTLAKQIQHQLDAEI